MNIYHWDEDLSLWWKCINVRKIYHCDENFSFDETFSMQWTFDPVIKVFHYDRNISLWWKYFIVMIFITLMKIYCSGKFSTDENVILWWKIITLTNDESFSHRWLMKIYRFDKKIFYGEEIYLFELLSIIGWFF